MKILLVGGNGFIGRNLKEYLSNKDEYQIDAPSHKEMDGIEEQSVFRVLSETYYDVVIHAAVYNPRVGVEKDAEKELEYDLRLFYNFYKYRNMYGRMFYFGSGAEFDKRYDIQSAKEVEINRLIPVTEYGFAKYIINEQIKASDNIYNLRVFGLFGKYENWAKTFISGNICRAMKGLPITIRQNVYFDFLYVDDFCAIIERLLNTDVKNREINVVTGQRIDLVSIAKLIQEVVNPKVGIFVCKSGEGLEYTASNERLIQEIGKVEYLPMKDSIKKLYEYYRRKEEEIDIMSLLY